MLIIAHCVLSLVHEVIQDDETKRLSKQKNSGRLIAL